MVMDRNSSGSCQTTSGFELQDEMVKLYLNQEAISGFDPNSIAKNVKYEGRIPNPWSEQSFDDSQNSNSECFPSYGHPNPIDGLNCGDVQEDYDFSDLVLKYISQMLMEEDMEEKACMFQESAALQAAERSFYEVIGEKYPPSADQKGSFGNVNVGDCDLKSSLNWDRGSPSSLSSSSSSLWAVIDSPVSTLPIPGRPGYGESVVQTVQLMKEGLKGKKNVHYDEEEKDSDRSYKQSAVSSQSTVKPEVFDKVLLCSGGKNESDLRRSWQSVSGKNAGDNNGHQKGYKGKKPFWKRENSGERDEAVDLRALLTHCAQAVASNDRRAADECLKQIRRHSSQTGDGMQRMAHYFADGLEARMAGCGTHIYKALITMPTSASDVLKAYQLFLAACPFRKISNFFSNKTIMNLIPRDATSLHIIDFGILYGFQWPCFIQRLSCMPGGPPRLRITGIDFPQPGFRPAERVEETGRRLANYAERFNVLFEFNAIAQKWETVKLEDLNITKGELLAVNCLYRLKNILDETVVSNSPRDAVLGMIHKLKPDVFVMGTVNGSYSAPFFTTRFREALFHYSSVFDMLEATAPREVHERMLLEKALFGREAMNVIACEGAERIERPETYKQSGARNARAGFRQLRLDEEIVRMSRERVKVYHKDFMIDGDGKWLFLGWKGRIIYALSSWKAG
ncbi:unnamed protein product [Cuscuta campestris]|uniref:Uncharacterized protein n=1 Tax=Cuscuta campestris TaxID=132261 RepID=A0A484LVF1_9ASTE|nr:unnamed protein product [Cuscuta campestris]